MKDFSIGYSVICVLFIHIWKTYSVNHTISDGRETTQSSDHVCDEITDVNYYEYLSEESEQMTYITEMSFLLLR